MALVGDDTPECPVGKNVYRFTIKEKDGVMTVHNTVAPTVDDAVGQIMEKVLGVESGDPAYDPMNFWDEYKIESVVTERVGKSAEGDRHA